MGCENHIHLHIYPAIREVVGGAQDGSLIFPNFSFDLNRFYRYFDNMPYSAFTTVDMAPTIVLFGSILGLNFRVQIHSVPPPNSELNEKFHVVGPKTGTVERVVQSETQED